MNVILTASQKKQIGKTLISIRAGIELSRQGKNVLMMDLSSGKIKMSEYLNVNENIIYDIVDVFTDTCPLEQAVIEIEENLSLLPCPRIPGKIDKINKDYFLKLLKYAENYDQVIIDIDKLTHSYIDFTQIQNVVSINNNDFSCIKEINTDKVLASKVDKFTLIINKYNKKAAKKGVMMTLKDIEKLTETTVATVIEENSKYSKADYQTIFTDNFLNLSPYLSLTFL
ncbi:MAG: septum site-determining protein MinD [Tissierellia bacterium]|nr:septum site-determining protein MinD [Tissierellia bacterium]